MSYTYESRNNQTSHINSVDIDKYVERIFVLSIGHMPNPDVRYDVRRMKRIKVELEDFQRELGLWMVKNNISNS